MSSTITYLPIFNLNILHNYFLDVGDTKIFDDTQKPANLSSYNVSEFLHITPSQDTKRVLANHKVVFKTTTDGGTCFISVDQDSKPVIDSTNVTVTLLVYSKDAFFEKYTDIKASPKGVYFFTNDPTEPDNEINALSDTASNLDEYKVVSSMDPMSKYQELLGTLTGKEQRSLLGIVSIKLDELLVAGAVGDTTEFKIVLKNRKTIWVYLEQDGTVASQTGQTLPFTQKGNIIPKDAANADIPHRMATPFDAFNYPEDSNQPIETQIYI
ncbi:hypothetical protein GCM10011344_28800 [Dokdonia pacifica]|uniref:Uncharacterized protein n=1 Tax=Dokdonia pacifica TaxID=1627892 RepID=A0A239C6X8_9FLAO|nr:hypothetical protein [Dokdonia pacifica]GGG26342.1 hypothetical protein GCM10011344_28800 [Dokdonia pacifica]SNS16015.1 hypothetical protein SAMN06265376_107163 [Dokdonia pacifica]